MRSPSSYGLPVLALFLAARCGAGEPVWDPTEIARIGEQAAQISLAFSAATDLQQQFNALLGAFGAAGTRGSPPSAATMSLSALTTLPKAVASLSAADLTAGLSAQSPNSGQIQQGRLLRQQAALSSAVDGLSLVQVVNQDLSQAASRAQTLSSQAAVAPDARADVQANSAVSLAVLAELTAIEALLALSLQGQSIQQTQLLAQ